MLSSRFNFFFLIFSSFSLSCSSFAETTKIGVLIPITGNYSNLGEDCRLGIEVGRIVRPDNKLEFDYADSQAEPKVAVTEFARLADSSKVAAVILSRSPVGLAVNPLSSKKKVPILGMVGHEEFTKQNPYAFQFWPTPRTEGIKLAQTSLALGRKTAAMIVSDDDWLLTLAEAFKSEYTNGGGKIVSEEQILSSETDLSTVLLRSLSKKPDLFYLNVSIGSLPSGIRRLREKSQVPIVSNFWVGNSKVIEAAGVTQSEGVGFPEVSFERDKFKEAYRKLNTTRLISGMTYNCYVAFAALDQITRESISSLSGPKIHDAMKALSEVNLIDESIPIRDRIVDYSLKYKEIRNGKVVELNQ